MTTGPRSHLLLRDQIAVSAHALRARRLRSALSALGVAIGIAAMVAVLGISDSSRGELLAQLDRLGTNLLTVQPGQSFGGGEVSLPTTARAALARADGVDGTASVTTLADIGVFRNEFIEPSRTNGLYVAAVDLEVADIVGAGKMSGRWHDAATAQYPAAVLGAKAAARLGIDHVGASVVIANQRFTVIGILGPLPLAPELDTAAMIGRTIASDFKDRSTTPTTIYVRTVDDAIDEVRALIPRTASPEAPEEVSVSRPSDVLAARAAAKTAFTSLFLALGAVALVVGGIGIGNVMVISVLERRREIGLRRALGATRRHVSTQFLVEALLLATGGGALGVTLGTVTTSAYALTRGWAVSIRLEIVVGGICTAAAVGAVSALYPATRAASLAPNEALHTT